MLKPQKSRLQLHRLNWPDFLLYEAANATLWRKIDEFGPDLVHKLANEIRTKSERLSTECLDFPTGNDTKAQFRHVMTPKGPLRVTPRGSNFLARQNPHVALTKKLVLIRFCRAHVQGDATYSEEQHSCL